MSECPYSIEDHHHPIFVYLTSDKRFITLKHLQQTVPYIGIHSNPYDDIRRQNRETGYTGADHTTKGGAGSLQLEIVIGPFTHDIACQFRDEWRKLGRKLISRVQKGIQQAMRYDADVYCLDVDWVNKQVKTIKVKRVKVNSLSDRTKAQ